MQLRDRLRAGTASFAHLAGLGRPSAARAEDDDERENEDRKDSKRAEGDDKPADDEDDKKESRRRARRAEDDDDDKRAEGDEDDQRAADDDGDDDGDKEEMRGRSAVARARSRERARCAAIFMSRHAAGNPAMAAELAFNTTLSRKEAISVLAAAPVGARNQRADRNPRLGPGGEPSPSSSQAVSASWDRAFGKVANPLGRRRA